MPVLNEEATIAGTLAALPAGAQIIVVDGGSTDETVTRAGEAAATVVESERGRARQMNAGAGRATGEVLLFLHADTRLPTSFPLELDRFLASGRVWGRFDVRLSGAAMMLRVIEFMMNWRSRLTGICTGDQAFLVRREIFDAENGFAEIALMEDIELSRRLKRRSWPWCSNARVVTSSRRWEERGIWPTILLMWRLRLAYFLGASPESLARRYR